MTFSYKVHSLVLGAAAACLLCACAAYTGPKVGSTAEPPVNPPRPAPLEPVYYDHAVRTDGAVLGQPGQPVSTAQTNVAWAEGRESGGYSVDVQSGTVEVRDGGDVSAGAATVHGESATDTLAAQISAAYNKRGRPIVAAVFYTAPDTIRMTPTMVPLVRRERNIAVDGTHTHTKKGDATLDVDIHDANTIYVRTGNSPSKTKLVSWSEVQQCMFEALRTCGIRVADTEMTTLRELDHLMGRTEQGLSLHTAELETLRKSADFEVLILVQEVYEHGGTWLQARAWDLAEGTLVAASRTKLLLGRNSATGELLARHRTRRLATEILRQAAMAWNQS